MGEKIPIKAKALILETTAREMTSADMQRLGPEYHIGLTEDPRRGKIIDVVRSQLAAPE